MNMVNRRFHYENQPLKLRWVAVGVNVLSS